MSTRETVAFAAMLAVVLWLSARYIAWWFDLDHLPRNYAGTAPVLVAVGNLLPFAALTILEGLRMLQLLVFWFFACFMADAVPLSPPTGLRVAVLTTIVPSKEPPETIEATFAAMARIRYAGHVDLWILDEEDDARVHALAQRYGVLHFTRHGVARYNQSSGPFAARTKAGNLNAWLDAHGDLYDVMGQMDCDHVPTPRFLEDTLGYFRDPDVGYVVAPQVYSRNADVNWIARGADEQNFGFSSITQRGANTLAMPILIGSNHLVRIAMMRAIGGYVSHVVEDHITGMLAMATRNLGTGRNWRGVYAHRIISRGEGPATWGAYLSQQMRWSFGLFQILRRSTPALIFRVRPRQAAGLLLIQSYYPSVAWVFAIGVGLTALQLFTGIGAINVGLSEWSSHWVPPTLASMALWYWMQRFYLERADRGVGVRGMLLGIGAAIVYVQAMLAALVGRHLPYVITPKGEHARREPLALFRWHITVLVVSIAAFGWSVAFGSGLGTLRAWAMVTAVLMALVIASGTLHRPREVARTSGVRVGGRYWLRIAAPTAVLAGVLVLSMPGLTGPETAANGESASTADPIASTEAVSASIASDTPHVPVPAAFLDATGPRTVALGAFDPSEALGGLPKIHHVFVDFRPERETEIADAVTRAAGEGQVALVTWEPRFSALTRTSAVPDPSVLEAIRRGDLDPYLRRVAASLRDSRQPVVLRFAHEMDLAPDGAHPWSGGDPATYIAAWRHLHDVFAEERATNVRFLWSPGGVIAGDEFVSQLWYPGSDVVDAVGFSALASWQWEPRRANQVDPYALRTPRELVMPRYRAIARFVKPVILPEVGVETHPGRVEEEQAWLRDFAALTSSADVPLLRGVVYFNAPHNLPNYDIDWRLSSNDIGLLRDAWVRDAGMETAAP